jgi:hypothetical protein
MPIEPSPPVPLLPVPTLPEALRLIATGDTLSVATAEGELFGSFQRCDGETLVLTISSETDADIPTSTIRGITRMRHCAGRGAMIAASIGALPFLWLTSLFMGNPRQLGPYFAIFAIIALVVIGALAAVGAVIGLVFDRGETLYRTPARSA